MEPWYKVTTPAKEVREGRSGSPDEFVVAIEQPVPGITVEEYRVSNESLATTFEATSFYRKSSKEQRLLNAMLLAVPR
jgi:hypothetical protein